MGFIYRKRVRVGKRGWLNISKSGVSGSAKAGPVTFNSRGRRSVRLGKGLSYRGGCLSVVVFLVLTASVAVTVVGNRILA